MKLSIVAKLLLSLLFVITSIAQADVVVKELNSKKVSDLCIISEIKFESNLISNCVYINN